MLTSVGSKEDEWSNTTWSWRTNPVPESDSKVVGCVIVKANLKSGDLFPVGPFAGINWNRFIFVLDTDVTLGLYPNV